MRPASIHTGGWRYPGAIPDSNFSFPAHVRYAQALERGCFDAIFLADSQAVLPMPTAALKRSATVSSFDPLTLLPALAAVTRHIGLIATASTTYNAPFHVARRFATLDHISGGRAGWNVVTSGNPHEAMNFGLSEHLEHDERYRRAREFYQVVTGLWDSWADDAFRLDQQQGIFFDPEKLHALGHKGAYFDVRGPMNLARPPQGWPVIVQAGSSEAGMALAAETAEMVFTSQTELEEARAFYADVKGRMAGHGRAQDQLKVMPGAFVVVGDSAEEALQTKRRLDRLVHPDSGIASLSVVLGHDVSGADLDGPLPEIPESNASRSGRQKIVDLARRENLTVRELAQIVGGSYGQLEFVGTPAMIADRMQQWLEAEACDGFNVMFPFVPQGLDDFVGKVVPELQARGLFRRAYEGATLRENLGLARPGNRFFS